MSKAVKPRRDPHLAHSQVTPEWDTPMYRLAVSQLDQTAERINLDPNIWQRLRTPQRAHVVTFPFRPLGGPEPALHNLLLSTLTKTGLIFSARFARGVI
jgi:hypothetical protein